MRIFTVVALLAPLVLWVNASADWEVPVTTTFDGGDLSTVYLATNDLATDDYNEGIDQESPPSPPSGLYTYFSIPGYKLIKDARYPGDPTIVWKLKVVADEEADTITWNPADLPTGGRFIFDVAGLAINMREESLAVYTGAQTIYIKYSYAEGWEVPITTTFNGGDLSTVYFATDDLATDGWDEGIDQESPPAPPSGLYTYFSIPDYKLIKDVRHPGDPTIVWKLKVAADEETDTITWDSADLPTEGGFVFDTAGVALDMREENLAVYTGAQTIYIKYTAAKTYTIDGIVDLSDEPEDLSGTIVTLNGKVDTTDTQGYYKITGVSAGTYDITVEHSGYWTKVDASVAISSEMTMNYTLNKILTGWEVPITTTFNGGDLSTVYFATDNLATDGWDEGIDQESPPSPPSGLYTYFSIPGYKLIKDVRYPGDPTIIWTLKVAADEETDTVTWNPADLPVDGEFIFDTDGLALDMREESLAVYTGAQTIYIRYTGAGTYTVDGVVGLSDEPEDSSGTIVTLNGKVDTTDSHGYYCITNVAAGAYDITIEHSGYGTGTDEDVVISSDITINYTLDRVLASWEVPISTTFNGGDLSTVYFATDDLATDGWDAGIDQESPPPPPSGLYTYFSISGYKLIKDVRSTTDSSIIWTLKVAADEETDTITWSPADLPDFGRFVFDTDGLALNMREESLAVYTGAQTIYVEYSLLPLTYTVSGVVGLSDNPVDSSGTLVTINGYSDSTDAHGYYEIAGVLAGTYDVTVTHEGYVTVVDPDVDISTDITLNYTLELVTYTVSGVVGLSDNPADSSGTLVTINGYSDSTDAHGHYEITEVLAGTYDVTVTHEGYVTVVNPNVAISSDITLNYTLNKTYTLSGVVGLADNPADSSGTEVMVTGGFWDSTDVHGYYEIPGLLAGRYNIIVTHEGYNTVFITRVNISADTVIDTTLVPVVTGIEEIPTVSFLSQNKPNPFASGTTIEYGITKAGNVEIAVYNVVGQKVRTLVSAEEKAGYHKVNWDGTNDSGAKVGGGIYFYKITAGEFTSLKKLILLR